MKKDFFKGSTAVTSLKLNTGAIVFVSNDSDKSVNLICTDIDFNSRWSTKVDGYFQHAAALGKNVIILVSTDFTFFTRANSTFKAYLLDGTTGKLVREKIVFQGNNDFLTLPYFVGGNDDKTYTVAVRETAVKRNVKIAPGTLAALYLIKKLSDQEHKVKAFNVITLDENLEQKELLSPDLPAGQFVGIQRAKNNDLYIAVSENAKGITISQYLPGSDKPVKSLTEAYSFKTGWLDTEYLNDRLKLMTDTVNDHAVYLSGAFKNGEDFTLIFNKYDFATDKHIRFKKNYTRPEVKALEKSYIPVNKKYKKLSLASAGQLELVGSVINENGYFLVVSDFQYIIPQLHSSSTPVEVSEGLIVYHLDNEMTVKNISAVPRYFSGLKRAEVKTYQKGNQLYIMAAHQEAGQFLLSKINSSTGDVKDISLVSPEKAGRYDHPNLGSAVVADDSIILPVLDFRLYTIGKINFDVNMYRFNW